MEPSLFQALLNNIFITAVSCLLPLAVGFTAYWLCNKNEHLTMIARILGILFESFCPIVTIGFLYYCGLGQLNGQLNVNCILICIIGFSISFIGYMPLRYDPKNSIIKNLVVNTLGLISTVFKWSFTTGMIAVFDLLTYAKMARTFGVASSFVFIPVFFISFVLVLILETLKFIANEKM